MFLNNKYTTLYYKIINHYQQMQTLSGYKEQHHIVPRSLGGSDTESNLVYLTGKAHFICHHLLTKMTTGTDKFKMINAFWRMVHSPQHSQQITAKVYEKLKEERSNLLKTHMTGNKNHFYGKRHTNRTKAAMSEKAKARYKKNGPTSGAFDNGHEAWNKGLSKNTSKSINTMAENRKGELNPMAGRCGKDHPNSVSVKLSNQAGEEINRFESIKEVKEYCYRNSIPFMGIYRAFRMSKPYAVGGQYKQFNGWSLTRV